MHSTVSSIVNSENSLLQILRHQAKNIPKDFDFLRIDVDGSDYWLLHDIWKPPTNKEQTYRPKVVCIEANPTMPNDLIYIPPRSDTLRHGAYLAALVELAEQNDYVLIETTIYNALFVPQELYTNYFYDLVPDTSIEALREMTMGTSSLRRYAASNSQKRYAGPHLDSYAPRVQERNPAQENGKETSYSSTCSNTYRRWSHYHVTR